MFIGDIPFVLYFPISHSSYTSPYHTHTENFSLVLILQKMHCSLSEHNDKKAVKSLTDNLPSPFLPLEMTHALWVVLHEILTCQKYIVLKKSEHHKKEKSTPKMLIATLLQKTLPSTDSWSLSDISLIFPSLTLCIYATIMKMVLIFFLCIFFPVCSILSHCHTRDSYNFWQLPPKLFLFFSQQLMRKSPEMPGNSELQVTPSWGVHSSP